MSKPDPLDTDVARTAPPDPLDGHQDNPRDDEIPHHSLERLAAISTSGLPPQAAIDDIPVKVSVVLGTRKIDIASLKALTDGSVIELDRRVGEPVDIYVNDQMIARGELVRMDDGIGVSLTEITRKKQNTEL